MGDNLKIRKLKADLSQVLNESLLPVEVKRLIIDDLNQELLQLSNEMVEKERKELLKENEEKESESNGISSDN